MEYYNSIQPNIYVLPLVVATTFLSLWAVRRPSAKSLDLDGPPNPSWLHGTGLESTKGNERLQEELKSYGKTVKYYGMFGTQSIHTIDPVALHAVTVKDANRYERDSARVIFQAVLGGGLLAISGSKHRMHRKILNPVFVTKHLREREGVSEQPLDTPIFDSIALQACDSIMRDQSIQPGQSFNCDIYRYMNAAALELIGQAGLGYSFDSFAGRRNDYSASIKHLLPALTSASAWLPFVVIFKDFGTARLRRWIVDHAPFKVIQDLRNLVRVQRDQAYEVLSSRKISLASGLDLDNITGSGRDIMTLLMKANETLPVDEQMSIDEMIAHINTFIFAGHETTRQDGAVTRALDTLSKFPGIQERLRAELNAFIAEADGNVVDHDRIDALPYLDAICREVLRLTSPVSMSKRIAVEDSILPLKYPVNTSKGPQTSIFVPKGTEIHIGIYGINRDQDIWGPDAEQFNPERWLNGNASLAEGTPGIYSHMMTFLAGPSACIGFKFAVLEIKVLLARLVTRFKFERTDKEFVWQLSGTQSPYRLEDADVAAAGRKAQLTMKLTAL
ncbi:cytochrome P450 [Ceratobasidium sp. AG-I]|nr:cytochrome P450 [Ceratobasidium sp. AG-I]